jgi:hypothetical protein
LTWLTSAGADLPEEQTALVELMSAWQTLAIAGSDEQKGVHPPQLDLMKCEHMLGDPSDAIHGMCLEQQQQVALPAGAAVAG